MGRLTLFLKNLRRCIKTQDDNISEQKNIVFISEHQVWTNNLERTLDRLYKCRDLEIANLWQRSVFLAVFLTLCLTGYGILVSKLFSLDTISEINKQTFTHIGAIGIGILGFLFSLIWIMMAKGSKAWYEVYEGAIYNFEEEFQVDLQIPDMYRMGINDGVDGKLNSSIISVKSGAYSPSKINIVIGQIFLLLWIVVMLIHGFFLFSIELPLCACCWAILSLLFLVGLSTFIIIQSKSSHLSKEGIKEREGYRESADKFREKRDSERNYEDVYYFNTDKYLKNK
ncbi:RipA family octameric membrane protein [Dysgonomonas macrotermitis]|uniref:Uncharacterized protein n=1 Tax=Dysgonomonas macrotermitis TaxID=1346286 RepID=A0A1M4XXH7_9BACT|nr:hypothetical protein [Dysgonomonas macrotermitis]SHE98145.1 hypothetical protein SAMN05444362_10315 [Dysgonomonas macrotermitis]